MNEWRGVPLPSRADRVMDALETIADRGETELSLRLGMLWRTLVETPAYDGPPVWLHGDLHPLNLLVEGDELTAVIGGTPPRVTRPRTLPSPGWLSNPASGFG